MKNWKQAFWLAKFELKESKLSFLLLLLFYSLIILGLISSLESYLDTNFVGLDFFFILLFTYAATWTKPKHFQVQQMNDELVASPTIFMLQQLPITKDLIVKSKFIIYLVYSVPPQILLLISLYLFTPALHGMIEVSSYLVFAIIWLSFGVYIGGVIPASDAGDNASKLKVAVYGVLMLIALIVFFTIFRLVSDHGIVYWTLIFAKKWPLLSGVSSIILAIFGFNYWQSYMKKMMGKLDYL
jgi:hypothetical protein